MTRRLQFLLALVLCAGLTALTFSPAQAQEKKKQPNVDLTQPSMGVVPAEALRARSSEETVGLQLAPGRAAWGYKAFAAADPDTFATFPLDDPSTVTSFQGTATAGFPNAGTIGSDTTKAYAIFGSELYEVDIPTGAATDLGDLGTTNDFTGMAYDPDADVYYGVAAAVDENPGILYTVDIDGVSVTEVGSTTGTINPIAIAYDNSDDTLYGFDLDDNFFSLDTSTGAATTIGALDFDSNYGQGLTWDPVADEVYMSAVELIGFGSESQLRTVDTSTGSTTLIGAIEGNAQFAWISARASIQLPVLSVSPSSIDLSGSVGGTASQTVTLSNNGGDPLTVSDLSITGSGAGNFSITGAPTTPFTVSEGGSETFDVEFTSSSAIDVTADLEITSDDGGNPGTVTTVPLTGQSFEPVTSIDEDFEEVTPPALPIGWSIANVNGDDEVWEGSTVKASSGSNSAGIGYNASLAMDDWLFTIPLDLTGGTTYRVQFNYAVRSSTFPENLAVSFGDAATPGAMTDPPLFSEEGLTNEAFEDGTVSFTPSSDGIYYVGFHGFSDANEFGLYVDDVVVEEAPAEPSFLAEPDTVAFGGVLTPDLGTDSTHVEVSNDGGGTLTVEEPSITGTDPSAFTIEDDTTGYPTDLGASESLGFDVGLSETLEPGAYEATLEISYDDGSGSQTATIPLSVVVNNPNFGGPTADYYYANSTESTQDNPDFVAPGVVSLDIPSGNENDVTSQLGDGDIAGPFDIGFDFVYFGATYDSFCLASDGWIELLNGATCTDPASPYINDPIPTADDPNNMIAWFWDDLSAEANDGTTVSYGADEDGNLIVSFEDYGVFLGDPTEFISADVKLYQSADDATNGKIRLQYNDFGVDFDTTGGALGIENADGSVGLQYRYEEDGGPLTVGGDTLALVFGPEQSALPVELADFTAATSDGGVDLSWRTLSETNNKGFQVMMKRDLTAADGSSQPEEHWQQVGFVESAAPGGTSVEARSYSLRVPDLDAGHYTFRLDQVDLGSGAPTPSDQTVEASVGFEGAYQLSGAYPNPFRQEATFEIAVKETQHVTVEVYDMLGRRVMKVFDGQLEGGSRAQMITVKARSLASGVYFYRVTGEDFTASKKMMLVR